MFIILSRFKTAQTLCIKYPQLPRKALSRRRGTLAEEASSPQRFYLYNTPHLLIQEAIKYIKTLVHASGSQR